ncbi:TPA: DNA-binding transcriptional regulator [Escherichia coli]|nr:DNA-binding transcriptional regulator [Escherichia coli]HCP1973016.1 DNA-binding transcriptional regulator [Escherichia coli]
MFHCPLCQHAAHARTSRYITDTTKERYHQCQNVNCSATFITYESVQRYIVKPGEVHAVRPHPLRQGSKLCGCDHKNSPSVERLIYGRCGRYVDSG